MVIKKMGEKYREFGRGVTNWKILSKLFSYGKHPNSFTWKVNEKKHKAIIKYLLKKYDGIINQYSDVQSCVEKNNSNFIWTLWWQGKKQMPEIIKLCHNSLKQNCGSREVIVISKDNIAEYINIPNYIMDKVEKGKISFTHLSDIIRMNLLKKYGGLWIDSTIMVNEEIPNEIFDSPYFTRKVLPQKIGCVSKARWTGGVLAATKMNPYISYMVSFFNEYWHEEKSLIDYFLVDYATEIAYCRFPFYKKMLDKVPINNKNIFELGNLANSAWNKNEWERLTKDTIFFRLSWKQKFLEQTPDGKQTFYGYLKEKYLKNKG